MLEIKKFTFSPIEENTYVLYNESGDACIIDPGCYSPAEERHLAAFIGRQMLKPVLLLNTHCHLDHVFGLAWAAKQYGLKPTMHTHEGIMLKFAPQSGEKWGLPFIGYEGPINFIEPGEPVFIGNDRLETLFAPGHSPGHLCFYQKEQQFVIGGDVLFRQSIGRTDLPMGNHDQLLESIRTQLFVLPPETVVYAGHGPETTIGYEKRHNPYLMAD